MGEKEDGEDKEAGAIGALTRTDLNCSFHTVRGRT